MDYQFIFDEAFVKGLLPVSENVAGGYMRTAMFEAQELDLKAITGACLLEKLQAVAALAPLEEDIYTACIDKCLYYLSYRTLVRLVPKVTYKIASAGTFQVNDERTSPLTAEIAHSLEYEYKNSADQFAYELQGWLLKNSKDIPELCGCDCERLRANLRSADSVCPIWLGGPRGNFDGGLCK